ncbi:MAG TPA: glycerophosphodiester phosphodiesterase [Acidimicrobiales bacterium]
MAPRLPSLISPPIAFGHRGARAHSAENTLPSFKLALKLGATGLESDVWLTADGEPVLDHDGVVRSGLRKRPIGELRREQLPAHIPTLADLLEACGYSYQLSLDLKDGHAVHAVVAVVRSVAPELLPRLWLCHPDWRQLASWRSIDADVKLVDSTRLARMKEGPERRAANLQQAGIDAVNMHHTDWTGGLTTLFHRFERFALSWDLQHERVLRDGLSMGVDGIFSDWVDRMIDAMRAEGFAP